MGEPEGPNYEVTIRPNENVFRPHIMVDDTDIVQSLEKRSVQKIMLGSMPP